MELFEIAKVRYRDADGGDDTEKHKCDAEVNGGLMHANALRGFGLLAYCSEEANDRQTEAGHGEDSSDPCERCSIECDAGAEGCQFCAAFGERNTRIGWWGFGHGFKRSSFWWPDCTRES